VSSHAIFTASLDNGWYSLTTDCGLNSCPKPALHGGVRLEVGDLQRHLRRRELVDTDFAARDALDWDRQLRAEADALADPDTRRALREMFGDADQGYGRYALELVRYASDHDFVVHPNQDVKDCSQRLEDPRHHCSSNKCPRPYSRRLDHTVLLRRPDKSGWAILSQEYDTAASRSRLGEAPYGNGTVPRLIVGAQR